MFAITLTGLAFAAPAESPARPASIPERWLLKLMPKELPKLPEAFSKTTWTEQHNPRAGGGWIDWYAFAPEAGEVTVTRRNFRGFDADAGTKGVTVRTAPRRPRRARGVRPQAFHGRAFGVEEVEGGVHGAVEPRRGGRGAAERLISSIQRRTREGEV